MEEYVKNYSSDYYKERECAKFAEEGKDLVPEGWCPWNWNYVLCWPPSSPGSLAVRPCFGELQGIKYDTSQNASRVCLEGGRWSNYSNYSNCIHVLVDTPELSNAAGLENTTNIYVTGYSLSLLALIAAVAIFLYFKDLKCLRNKIHTNLMLTYIMADSLWILNYALQVWIASDVSACIFLNVLLHYFHMTNFFWMFVEGFYLYMLVVQTFTSENIKLRVYLIIGWGTPSILILIWAIIRSVYYAHDQLNGNVSAEGELEVGEDVGKRLYCSWISDHGSDWIYQAPALLVLVVNFLFLIRIMWVLITKLRSATNVETQQYRKATKALLVLIPLLGITYILVLVGPTEGLMAAIYAYIRALLLSTQGLMVALFYCFLNGEVRNTVLHHVDRWKETRDIERRLSAKSDPRPGNHYKKRESAISTTTAFTVVGCTHRISNGSVIATLRPDPNML